MTSTSLISHGSVADICLDPTRTILIVCSKYGCLVSRDLTLCKYISTFIRCLLAHSCNISASDASNTPLDGRFLSNFTNCPHLFHMYQSPALVRHHSLSSDGMQDPVRLCYQDTNDMKECMTLMNSCTG